MKVWNASCLPSQRPKLFKACNMEVLALPLSLQILAKTCSPCHFQKVLCYTQIIHSLCSLFMSIYLQISRNSNDLMAGVQECKSKIRIVTQAIW